MLGACVSHVGEAVNKHTGAIDVAALEKFGTKIEKYDFAPHRAVLDVSGAVIGNSVNIMESLRISCKNAGGIYSSGSWFASKTSSSYNHQGSINTHTAFSEIFLYKMGRKAYGEILDTECRCEIPGKRTVEITGTRIFDNSSRKLKQFMVIQEDDDIKATRLLIAQIDDEAGRMLQSVINDWQRTSETLRNDLKSGNKVFLVQEVSSPSTIAMRNKLKAIAGDKEVVIDGQNLWSETEGLVIEIKPPLVLVQSKNNSPQWVKLEDVHAKVPYMLYCANEEVTKSGSNKYKKNKYKGGCFQTQ